jgi:anti-anti-sigma factor
MPGNILAAEHAGHYVLKMSGDVRVNLCAMIDEYLESMFSDEQFCAVILDLTEVKGVDSTTLGLMAKLALQTHKLIGDYPVLFSPNASITRLLHSMGFDSIFVIREQVGKQEDWSVLPVVPADEDNIRGRVIMAHRTLMSLNETNREDFSELVNTLERT